MKSNLLKILLFLLTTCSMSGCNVPKTWTLNTEDTKLTIGINDDSQLCIYELSNPKSGWNWTSNPSFFPFLDKVEFNNKSYKPKWVFQNATQDLSEGKKVTLHFKSENPDLELQSIWHARPGKGPIHHSMFITNNNEDTMVIYPQQSLVFKLSIPEATSQPISLWYFHDNAFFPDEIGTYKRPVNKGFSETINSTTGKGCWKGGDDFIPYAVIDSDGKHGMYIGLEWSNARTTIHAVGEEKVTGIRLVSGLYDDFKTDVYAGETFEVPAGFVGAYNGDIDDAGNSLRKYLFKYNMPEILRTDTSYPKLNWNAIHPTAKEWCTWYSEEKKYYPFIESIASLGFEEVTVEINWWDPNSQRNSHPVDWPSGMLAASEAAHHLGINFVLYWNLVSPLTQKEGIAKQIDDATYLYKNYNIDVYRTDCTAGPLIQGGRGGNNRAQYETDVPYWATKGFFKVIDSLDSAIPNFKWENCTCGSAFMDFASMKRCIRIQGSDMYKSIQARMFFYDASHVFPPMQLMGFNSGISNYPDSDIFPESYDKKLMFRSASMGACGWLPVGPEGFSGHMRPWTEEEKQNIKKAVHTYKTKIRPLIRNANLYHIFPRPDGIHWDGIEYYDPDSRRGVVFIFKPLLNDNTPTRGLKNIKPLPDDTTHTIRLKGLDNNLNYRLTFEDGTNIETAMKGEALVKNGITVTLPNGITSELMFIESTGNNE